MEALLDELRLEASHLPNHPTKLAPSDFPNDLTIISIFLVACPESRQLRWLLLSATGHPNCLPLNEVSFHTWLCKNRKTISEKQRRGFDTIVTLGAR
uniref:Uncharacterized protein n=1 Tax=Oryza rufipogon TaxID=4529 RepID=A0A0E0NWP1_ORYRU